MTVEAVDRTFRQIAETSAEGSILLFTYVERSILDDPAQYHGGPRLIARLESYGEPWTFEFHARDVPSYLSARGFELLKDVDVAEIWRHASRSESATHGYEFYRIAAARVTR